MTVDKFDNVWGSTGDTGTAPTDAKKLTGFVRNDKPTWQRENFLQNRVEKKINETIREGTSTLYDASTNHKRMVASGLYDESWGNCGDDQNQIQHGSRSYFTLVANIDSDGNPFIITCDTNTQKFDRYNTRTLALNTTGAIYTDDLPATAGTWTLHSLCSDNENIFGLFTESAGNTWVVQSWSATDLAVNPSWPATGTLLPGTGAVAVTAVNSPELIIASATQIAVGNSWNTISSSSSAAISLLTISNGTLESSGAGDAPTGVSGEFYRGIASDGSNIFFGVYGSSHHLCTAKISDLTSGTGGTGYPKTIDDIIYSICSLGRMMWIAKGSATATATDSIGITCDKYESSMHDIILGTDSAGNISKSTILAEAKRTVYDGFNIWTLGTNGPTGFPVLVKMDAGRLWGNSNPPDIGQPDIVSGVYPAVPFGTVSLLEQCSLCFDGRDIWCIYRVGTGYPIVRIPLASLRG